MSNQNSLPPTLIERTKSLIGFMLLQIADEDLQKLDRDYPNGKWKEILLKLLLYPKSKWKELGVPDYLMKYEIVNEDEED